MVDPEEENVRLAVQELKYLEEEFGDKEWPFSGKGGLDEIPVPAGNACVKISNALAAVNKNVSENMRDLARNSPIHQELAAAIENMTPDNDKFALLLTHKYTKTNIAPSGSRALEGVDHDRFLALVEANNFVSVEKKLQFRIAQLDHEVNFFFAHGNILGRYDVEYHEEKVAGRFGRKESWLWRRNQVETELSQPRHGDVLSALDVVYVLAKKERREIAYTLDLPSLRGPL